jgi:aryl-alcohol dehydrogenase-like predicted oxidoreductase
MTLPASSYLDLIPDLRICRILTGMWQVSGAHGRIEPKAALDAMLAYHDAGYTTWDLADHYGPAEDFIGAFRERLASERGAAALASVRAFTKWVPRPGPMTREIVEAAVDRSLRRMRMERLDMLQFHWWDYRDRRYLDALRHLNDLRAEGKILALGLTNFDTTHLREILDAGVPITTNQIQFSLIDQRPLVAMTELCQHRGVGLLAYGAIAGGLLSERWMGQPEPELRRLETASQQKYKEMIDAWGGWALFQELLAALYRVGQTRKASVSAVAIAAILSQPAVAGVIAGARLGVSQHLADTTRALSVELDSGDRQRIEAVTSRGADLYVLIGDCGDEYRR